MQSDLVLFRLARDIEFDGTDPDQAIRALLGEVLHKEEDGKYRIPVEDSEDISEFIREMFRTYRQVRRKGRRVDEISIKIADEELRETFLSMSGKFAISKMMEQMLESHRFDGLKTWQDEHFESTDVGITLREGAEQEITTILQDVQAVAKELEKDDF